MFPILPFDANGINSNHASVRGEVCVTVGPLTAMLALVFFLFTLTVCKFAAETCSKNDPLPVRHEWQQPGDVLLGGMSSQIIYILFPLSFDKHPSEELDADFPM